MKQIIKKEVISQPVNMCCIFCKVKLRSSLNREDTVNITDSYMRSGLIYY